MSTGRKPTGRRRPAKNTFTTKSGNTIKLNRSLGDRIRASRDDKARRRAATLSSLPPERWKRILYRLGPRRVFHYWFSREGAIMALKLTGISIVVGFVLLVALFAYYRKDLPNITDISGDKIGGSISYYDRTGQTLLFQDYDAVKRIPVKTGDMSKYMRDAAVAIEDKDFRKHGAFDVRGILRAGLNDIFKRGGGVQGGSTISQQLVKLNEQWTADRTITRKVREVILAVDLERSYSKDDILTGYLNLIPLGGVEYGVESAARDYFGVSAKDLSLAQSAMLAAIPKSPTTYSPYSSPQYNPATSGDEFDRQGLLDRQHYILDQMAKQKMITQAEASAAKAVDILSQIHQLQPHYQGIQAPYFVLTAKHELEKKYGADTVRRGGWKVITTLDLSIQKAAEKAVTDNIPSMTRLTGGAADQAASVAEDVQTGQIVALVGGTDFSKSENNYASSILIPPGSSFKPYDAATFINNNNAGAGSVMYDSPTEKNVLPGYPCTDTGLPPPRGTGNCLRDYDGLYPGPLTLRYALGSSRNVPWVKAMLSAVPNDTSNGRVDSVNKVISTATAMMDNPYVKGNTYNCYSDEQNTKPTQCFGAAAIGDGAFLHLDDHVNGLSTLARLGVAIPRTYILQISDASGKVIPGSEFKQPQGTQVLKPDAAYIVDDMASDPRASYLPGTCTDTSCTKLSNGGYKFHRFNGWKFAIKTGTTNNGFDGLMTSWSSKYAVVSWVGNNNRNRDLSAARGASMEQLTEPITRTVMEAAHANLKPENWVQPPGVKSLPAFVVTKHIHYGDQEPSPANDLFPSWYQQPKGGTASSQTIDKVSNKLATSCTPDLAKQTQSGGNDNVFSVDVFVNKGAVAATTATDDVHNCNDTKPSVTLTPPTSCTASGCSFNVVVTAGSHPLSADKFPGTVNLLVNGQVVGTKTVTDSPSTVIFTYTPTTDGAATVQAQVIDSVLYSAQDQKSVVFSTSTATTTVVTNRGRKGGPRAVTISSLH